ncbi:MAG: exo-alpha-sialidase [Clostridia bacterium]|nr:exo-alpha-sialidase [Clostridia bacterium]
MKQATNFFVRFSTPRSISAIAPFGKTATAVLYDETEQAALVVPTENGAYESPSIEFPAMGAANCREYPVFAMHVKLKNPETTFGRFYWHTDAVSDLRQKLEGTGANVGYWQFIRKVQPDYAPTTDWQLCVADFSEMHHPYFQGNWQIAMLTLMRIDGEGVTTDDGVYIDWMGWFSSVADAYEYADLPYEAPKKEEVQRPANEQRAMESSLKINNRLNGDLKRLSSVERVLVSDYDPKQTFKHHPDITYFKGKFYVSFSSGVKDEDHPGQKMVYCVSDDFYHWSEPMDVVVPGVTPQTDSKFTEAPTSIIGGFTVKGDRLCFLYTVTDYHPECFREDGSFNTNHLGKATYRNYMVSSEDGIYWSKPTQPDANCRNNMMLPSPYGMHRWYEFYGKQASYSDDGEHWTTTRATDAQIAASVARCPGQLTESAGFQSPDGVVHNFIRSDCGYIWQNESYDNGETWTEFYPTNFTSASSMFKLIYLPDGRIAWIGSPYYDTRWPLTLYVSEDGYNFNKGYILCDDVYEMKTDGWAKGGQIAYPHVMIRDEYLYVFYSKQKEVTEILRVKLTEL